MAKIRRGRSGVGAATSRGTRAQDRMAGVFAVGCREGNVEILRMLPTDVHSVMRRLGITKMPANRRVNDLMDAGLLERELGTGQLMPTPLTGELLKALDRAAKVGGKGNV